MLFNSYEFVFLFLPVAFVVFVLLAQRSHHLAALWLVAASLLFYGWWNAKYVALLLMSIGMNYAMGYTIARAGKTANTGNLARRLLAIAITLDLILLGYFKYWNFFVATAGSLTGSDWTMGQIVLPLGISFFTFTQIMFLVDVYRGITREFNFVHYVLFVTYFPHLIAGPIIHHKQVMPQFADPLIYRLNWENVGVGATYFTIGLSKKVLLADSLAEYATPVFGAARDGAAMTLFSCWIGVVAYSFQLYFDFSGYSDMAIGLSKMFGVDLPLNFNSPYKAHSIREFWERWHMTLSQFLRDYLYIPLGGSRGGLLRGLRNLMITMLLAGLWHGANWTFVIWGALHGFYLLVNHAWRYFVPESYGFPSRAASTLLTYFAVTIAWVFFRAETVSTALGILKGMAGLNGLSLPMALSWISPYLASFQLVFRFDGLSPELAEPQRALSIISWFTLSSLIIWAMPNSQEVILRVRGMSTYRRRFAGIFFGTLFAISLLSLSRVSEFLYFQF